MRPITADVFIYVFQLKCSCYCTDETNKSYVVLCASFEVSLLFENPMNGTKVVETDYNIL